MMTTTCVSGSTMGMYGGGGDSSVKEQIDAAESFYASAAML